MLQNIISHRPSIGGFKWGEPGVQILSISCSFLGGKFGKIVCCRPSWRVRAPTSGNPGSATAVRSKLNKFEHVWGCSCMARSNVSWIIITCDRKHYLLATSLPAGSNIDLIMIQEPLRIILIVFNEQREDKTGSFCDVYKQTTNVSLEILRGEDKLNRV